MLYQLLELAGNKALEFDSATQTRLEKLQGRTLKLQITTLNQSLFISSRAEGIEISQAEPEQTDVTLKASLNALFKLGRDGLDEVELDPGELEIIGDPLIGQRFAQVIAQLDIDWEAMLSEQVGPAPAKTIGVAASSAVKLAQQGRQQFHSFVIDTLKTQNGLVADQQEVDVFLDNVKQLSEQVDRLEQRLTILLDRGKE